MITPSGIEAFLAICRAKSISAAAEELFVCHSALSVRLKTLENELGTTLLVRKKGHREIILTKSGQEFFEIAQEYERVMNRIDVMRRGYENKLNISSLNSLGAYILPESYEIFMEKYPDVGLEIQDQELRVACKSILQGRTHLAFNTGHIVPDRIAVIPAFSENFTLICSSRSDYPEVVSPSMLKVKNEVYVGWFSGFEDYHTSVLGDASPQLRLDIMAQLKIFVRKPDHWAFVPASVARELVKSEGIRILKTDFQLPKRTVYCLHLADNALEENSILFLRCLREVLSRMDDVECLLPEL